MHAALDPTVTGHASIPFTDRTTRPARRGTRRSWLTRAHQSYRTRTEIRRAADAEREAELAAAPSEMHPRDVLIVRHADHELRRL